MRDLSSLSNLLKEKNVDMMHFHSYKNSDRIAFVMSKTFCRARFFMCLVTILGVSGLFRDVLHPPMQLLYPAGIFGTYE